MSIEAIGVSKTFGTFAALRGVDLTVATGELVALLGPSGSGKTTLLRIIAGLEAPDSGSGPIRFHDEDVGGRRASERRVGFVFQHYALFRHMSVFENIAFGLRVAPRRSRLSRREIQSKVEGLLGLVQLEGLARRRPNELSGGQRQRVALARALAVEPRVLLLDEPFGALDASVRQELRRWLRRLHDDVRATTILVTHDQNEALEVADRVVVMNRGRVEQAGTPEQVFHEPRTEFVMSFLGRANRFRCRVEDDKVRLAGLELDRPLGTGVREGEASVFVRPHDFELDTRPGIRPGLEARVVRVHSAGPTVRVDLVARSGDEIHVEITQERLRAQGIHSGSTVFVSPRDWKVFEHENGGSPDARGKEER